ncbi:hypothetical protein [Acetobacter okinawensis]|uniref:hypothetical protein n=1 Tax=Acetobacter okinawensis TaxID=1076594 RepID=UPI0039E73AEA
MIFGRGGLLLASPVRALCAGRWCMRGQKKGFWAWAGAGYMGIECDGQRAYSYGTKAM